MGITIDSDAPRQFSMKDEPCLCAQMSEVFSDFFRGKDTPEIRADLKANANPNCPICKGTGVENVEQNDAPHMQLSGVNASLFFSLLGLDIEKGEATLPEARRGLMRASSRSDLKPFTRDEQITYGKPIEIEPGVIEMKPMRSLSLGLDEEKLKRYLETFAEFLNKISQLGAKKILWY